MATALDVSVRKSKRGNVIRMVKEHYLRDDIPCGSILCERCVSMATELHAQVNQSLPTQLSNDPLKLLQENQPTYLLIDTQMALHQMDFLEHAFIQDVIVLRTVLDQLKEKNLSLYHRLRNLCSQPEKRFFIFSNEFFRSTYVQARPGESSLARSERAIFTAGKWYKSHLSNLGIHVVLLTNDNTVVDRAKQFGLPSITIKSFVDAVKSLAPDLADIVADTAEEGDDLSAEKIYVDYLSTGKVQAGLKAGLYYQGKLSIAPHNLFEGSIFANVDGKEVTIRIIGRKNLNRCVHEDIVAVELLPKEQWKTLQENVVIDEEGDETPVEQSTNEGENSAMQVDATFDDDISPVGRIVGVIKRSWRAYCGSIDPKSVKDQKSTSAAAQNVWFYPMEKRIPRIRIRTRQAQKLLGQRIIVNIDAWDRKSLYPRGHFVRALGSSGDKSTEVEVLLLEHDVPFQPFSQQVLACLPKEGEQWTVLPSHLDGKREDFRHLTICSIDPPGCTDIDDALHCRKLPNGNFEAGVHIADVTHFVKPDNPMDDEAARRGTTVYLVDKRIDMLPPLLGTNLCSLRSNVDRLAFSVVWEIQPDGEVVSVRYTKSIIRSKASLTYAEAQARMDDPKMQDDITQSIRYLNELAKKFRQKRTEAGSLTLSSPEVRFQLEHDSQDPVDVELKELKETNALVEDFMLLANIYVAKKIYESFPESAVLRRHPQPPQTNFDGLRRALEPYNIPLFTDDSKALADSLDKATLSGDEYFNKLCRILTTRCMMQAVYFCSGSLPDHEFWHYGLATPIYTHFTSPIRRYADVMVHRLLAASIDRDEILYANCLLDRVKVVNITDNLNYRHRMAQEASRSSVELYTNLFFRGKVLEEEGYVTRVLKNGFSVLVPRYGIEGFVYTAPNAAAKSPFEFNAEESSLSYGTDICLKIFSRVRIQITIDESSVAGLRQRLRMSLVSPYVPGLSVKNNQVE